MSIPVSTIKGIFTRAYFSVYQENIPVPSFLKSFFNVKTSDTKYVGIEVERGDEKIAADVVRGADGNRNQFSLSQEKMWQPPFYNENFDATQLDRYDRVFGREANASAQTIGYLAESTGKKLLELRKKIERAKELQAAQVFDTGVVTLSSGTNIDFKRRSTSQVDVGSGDNTQYWDNASAAIETQLIAGGQFIRTYGKNGTPEFNLIMSTAVFLELKASDYFTNKANYRQVQLIDIKMPQTESFGAGYHGTIVAGAYICHIWTYDETYKNADGDTVRYFPSDTVAMIPVMGTEFNMAHAGIPAIMADPSNAEFPEYIQQQAGEYWVNNYIDKKAKTHTFEIMSAPLAVPVTVDMIYTMTVLDTENPLAG